MFLTEEPSVRSHRLTFVSYIKIDIQEAAVLPTLLYHIACARMRVSTGEPKHGCVCAEGGIHVETLLLLELNFTVIYFFLPLQNRSRFCEYFKIRVLFR